MYATNGLSILLNLLVLLIHNLILTDHYDAVLGAGVALGAAQLGNYAGPGASEAGAEGVVHWRLVLKR